jgi:hypothetical protein
VPIGMIFKVVGTLGLIGLIVAALIAMAAVVVPVLAIGLGALFWYRRSRYRSSFRQ